MKNDVGTFKVAVAAVILNERNQVLLTQRSFEREHHPGEWEITTGRLAQGEGFVEALHREVSEELAIKVTPVIPINVFHFYRGAEQIEHVGVSYLCKYIDGEVKVDGVEEIAYKWVSLPEALELVKDQSIKQDLIKAQEFLENNIKSI